MLSAGSLLFILTAISQCDCVFRCSKLCYDKLCLYSTLPLSIPSLGSEYFFLFLYSVEVCKLHRCPSRCVMVWEDIPLHKWSLLDHKRIFVANISQFWTRKLKSTNILKYLSRCAVSTLGLTRAKEALSSSYGHSSSQHGIIGCSCAQVHRYGALPFVKTLVSVVRVIEKLYK